MKAITAIILAAGAGTRMHSSKQKVLHEICGKSMLEWAFSACEGNIEEKPVVIVGYDAQSVRAHGGNRAQYVLQDPNSSIAGAIMQALPLVEKRSGYVFIMHGNLPLISRETLGMLLDAAQGKAASRLVYCEEDEETDRKSTRLNSSHSAKSRMPSSA